MTLRPVLLAPAAAVLALAFAGPVAAQDKPDLSFNLGVASDYVFRGISQTNEDPEIFGGADVSLGNFYAGTWLSNVDYSDSTDMEFDLYAGFTPTIGAVSLDLGVYYYGYTDQPKGADYDYIELKAAGSVPLGPITLGAQAYYSPNYYSGMDHGFYYEATGAYAPTEKLSFSAALGRQEVSGSSDYTTWNIGVGYALTDHLGVDVRYHDTDKHSFGKTYGSRVAASLKATF